MGLCFLWSVLGFSQSVHPVLTNTSEGISQIKNNINDNSFFKDVLHRAIQEVDEEIAIGIEVPIPKDMAGGYTHERHKQNFYILKKAGNVYQITGEEKYAIYIKDMLMEYAVMYPTLDIHPTKRSYATGKIFWQCLNDANWLVYVSQAYDCIYEYLTPAERKYLETDLFKPFAEFLSVGNPKFFNRIHNHSTWANAAVGMIAIVMDDNVLLDRALYGIENDGIDPNAIDNDGGYIKVDGVRQAGFLAQLDHSFSPDGYFTEGPYYLRYAIFPFLEFGQALNNYKPELDIFNYREGILKKSIDGLLQQTDANGLFFPINDAQKGMSILSRELITAVDVLYHIDPKRKDLLSIAKSQNNVLLNTAGFEVATGLLNKESQAYEKKSMVFRDGAEGDRGGIAVIAKDKTSLVFKYSAQGMGHGHFDKLSYSLYNDSGEVIQDYGAVRWVNVDQKGGGRYLKENKTFGKQSIAHNTLVKNETSHYDGSVKKGEAHEPDLLFTDLGSDHQLLVASDSFAYEGNILLRNLLVISDSLFPEPLMVDVFKVKGTTEAQYDLPLWYMGHLLSTSFEYERSMSSLSVLGAENGYQHLWKEASGSCENPYFQMGWVGNDKFYTYTGSNQNDDEYIFARPGANDPNFNLRNDPVFIQRRSNCVNTAFVNIIESHGTYDKVTERPLNPYSAINSLEVLIDTEAYTAFSFEVKTGHRFTIIYSHLDYNQNKNHSLNLNGKTIKWMGPYFINKTKIN